MSLSYTLIINILNGSKRHSYIQKMPELIVLFNTIIPTKEKKKRDLTPPIN